MRVRYADQPAEVQTFDPNAAVVDTQTSSAAATAPAADEEPPRPAEQSATETSARKRKLTAWKQEAGARRRGSKTESVPWWLKRSAQAPAVAAEGGP